jgi:hypothetical protein
MRPYPFVTLLLPVALAACASPDRNVVLVQPAPEPRVVVVQPPPAPAGVTAPSQPVVVTPTSTDATVAHAVVNSYGGAIHMLPDSRSAVLTTLSPGVEVSVIGSTNWGTWDHVVANGVDGYMPHTELTSL